MRIRPALFAAALLYAASFATNAVVRERIIKENEHMEMDLAARYRFEPAVLVDFRELVQRPSQEDESVSNPAYTPASIYRYFLLTDNFINYRRRSMQFDLDFWNRVRDNRVMLPAEMRYSD